MPEPGHMLLKQQDTRKLYGLKLPHMFCGWGKFWAKDTESKTQPPLLKSQEETDCWKQKRGTKCTRCTQHHQRVRKAPKSSSCLACGRTPHPHPIRGTSFTTQGSKAGNLRFVPIPPVAAGAPVKPVWCLRCGSKSLRTHDARLSAEMNIETGHGAVGLLGYIPKCPNLFQKTVP